MTLRLASGDKRFLCAALLCLFAPAVARADVFRVGVGAGCTHVTIELALSAAAANGGSFDEIELVGPALALAGLVEILNTQVGLRGGFASCAAPAASGRTSLTYAGPGEAFWVHGTAGTQLNLIAVDVAPGPAAGRAITIEGYGEVVMEDATLTGGHAVEGGNVWISGPDALLVMTQGSEITFGEATVGEGGGVYCELGADVVLETNSKITDNTAAGAGGGIFLNGCFLNVDQSAGWAPAGAAEISRNKAISGSGGGIAAIGESRVWLLGWPAAGRPVMLSDNESVLGHGGGLAHNVGFGRVASLANTVVRGNIAGDSGGGIYFAGEGRLFMRAEPFYCPSGRGCSELSQNRSGAGGAGIFVQGGGFPEAAFNQTAIFGNYSTSPSAGAAVGVSGSSYVNIESCEIFDNDPNGGSGVETARISAAGSGAQVTIAFSTLVEETVGAGIPVLLNINATSLRLFSSIVQASKTFVSQVVTSQADCVIVAESASLPSILARHAVVTDPSLLFRLSTPTDFALFRGSQAQDFCNTSAFTPTTQDIDFQERGWNDFEPDLFGPHDLGADEWRPEILADGFESADMTHWSLLAP